MTENRHLVAEVALVALLFALGAALRLRDLDRFIAPDEVRWTCRSVNFVRALAHHDAAGTFQVGHPGVLTMWLGALALPRARVPLQPNHQTLMGRH